MTLVVMDLAEFAANWEKAEDGSPGPKLTFKPKTPSRLDVVG